MRVTRQPFISYSADKPLKLCEIDALLACLQTICAKFPVTYNTLRKQAACPTRCIFHVTEKDTLIIRYYHLIFNHGSNPAFCAAASIFADATYSSQLCPSSLARA